jgi:hypothetical protein
MYVYPYWRRSLVVIEKLLDNTIIPRAAFNSSAHYPTTRCYPPFSPLYTIFYSALPIAPGCHLALSLLFCQSAKWHTRTNLVVENQWNEAYSSRSLSESWSYRMSNGTSSCGSTVPTPTTNLSNQWNPSCEVSQIFVCCSILTLYYAASMKRPVRGKARKRLRPFTKPANIRNGFNTTCGSQL